MDRLATNDLYRCDLCRGSVDAATIDRARHSWQPLIICERCVRGTDDAPGPNAARNLRQAA